MSVQVGQFYRNKFTGYRAEVIRVRDSVSHSEVSVRLFSEDGAESLLWWASLGSLAARYELLPTVDEAHAEALYEAEDREFERQDQAVTIALQNLEIAALRRRLADTESELRLSRAMTASVLDELDALTGGTTQAPEIREYEIRYISDL